MFLNRAIGLTLLLFASIPALPNEYILPKEIGWITSVFKNRLVESGCKIPVEIDGSIVSAISSGQFATQGQNDLAVICDFNNNTRSILISWGGDVHCPDRIENAAQTISTVGKEFILKHYEWYGGDKPPAITHHGIDDGFVGKSSMVHYCYKGKWLLLTGAD